MNKKKLFIGIGIVFLIGFIFANTIFTIHPNETISADSSTQYCGSRLDCIRGSEDYLFFINGYGNQVDIYGFNNLENVDTVSSIDLCLEFDECYLATNYHWETYLNLYIGGSWQGESEIEDDNTDGRDYKCVTYSGSWSKNDINNAQGKIRANETDAGTLNKLYNFEMNVTYTTTPQISFINPSTSSGEKIQKFIEASVSSSDAEGISNTAIYLYNSTGLYQSNSTNTDNIFINFTNLDYDDYYLNATTTDTDGNTASTSTRTITLVSEYPVAQLNNPLDGSSNTSTDPLLNVTISDPDDTLLNATFINNSNILCENNSISNNSNVLCRWNNLKVGNNYNWKFNLTDKTTTQTYFYSFTVDNVSPEINIIDPKNKNYGDNESLPLNYTVSDSGVGVDSCWYKVVNETEDLIIDNTTITNCQNTTFDLPGGDINYNLTLYSNDSNGNMNNSIIQFGVRTVIPSITLDKPMDNKYFNYTKNINFNFTATDDDGIDTCKLYGNWTGNWKVNETFDSVSSGVQVNTQKNISENNNNIWNIWCNDSLGNSDYALNNYTFNIDITKPLVTNISTSTTKGSQTFTFGFNASDKNLDKCYYSIYNSTGDIEVVGGTSLENKNVTCNSAGNSETVSDFGIYTLVTWAEDKATNKNSTNQSFTTQEAEPTGGDGGGGETIVINATNWSMTTTFQGGKRYELNIIQGNKETNPLYFSNTGDSSKQITLTCQNIDNGKGVDMCKHTSFDKTEFSLPVLQEEKLTNDFTIAVPEDFEEGEYKFNIIATDRQGAIETVTIFVNVPSNVIIRFLDTLSLEVNGLTYWVWFLLEIIGGGLIAGFVFFSGKKPATRNGFSILTGFIMAVAFTAFFII